MTSEEIINSIRPHMNSLFESGMNISRAPKIVAQQYLATAARIESAISDLVNERDELLASSLKVISRAKWMEADRNAIAKERDEFREAIRKNSVVGIQNGVYDQHLWCAHCQRKLKLPSEERFEHAEDCIVRRIEKTQ